MFKERISPIQWISRYPADKIYPIASARLFEAWIALSSRYPSDKFIHRIKLRKTGSLTVSGKREKIHYKKRYDKTTTRLQSSLESPSSLLSHNRDSILTIETRFLQSRLDSHNRDSILTIETRFSQSRLDSHNRDSILTIETRFLQSRLDSHNRVSFLTIESRPYNRVSLL